MFADFHRASKCTPTCRLCCTCKYCNRLFFSLQSHIDSLEHLKSCKLHDDIGRINRNERSTYNLAKWKWKARFHNLNTSFPSIYLQMRSFEQLTLKKHFFTVVNTRCEWENVWSNCELDWLLSSAHVWVTHKQHSENYLLFVLCFRRVTWVFPVSVLIIFSKSALSKRRKSAIAANLNVNRCASRCGLAA